MDEIKRNNVEYARIKKLSEFDLDYGNLQNEFQGLVELAAHIAGTRISLINLIDSHSQWTVSSYCHKLFEMDREDSICQYTIQSESPMEIHRLDKDARFMDKPYVKDDGFKYYLGIPLMVETGESIGALCVIDHQDKNISEEKKKLLRLVADEIVKRLESKMKLDSLQDQLDRAIVQRNQMAHDVRGPVGGILGLALSAENESLEHSEFDLYMGMIKSSASKLLELTDDILERRKEQLKENYFTLSEFKKHLEDLYALPALNKKIDFGVVFNKEKNHHSFPRRKLLPISGNIIANAIKFTAPKGKIAVNLDIMDTEGNVSLLIEVKDNGRGIRKEKLQEFMGKSVVSERGTNNEEGYGMGLQLVNEMVRSMKGSLNIQSEEGKGTVVKIKIPVNRT
ncbi:GAF domain-containing sensor histidine kinase [Muricauda sp. 334s03]|uniref:histidine kinase n=1 Tax=Flagellimonas yonaguniensis TaxID=3031325 RepID=A0ABT5XY98_9FLAO|nr:GAF domain-containing sensor histidine kinase [[Muricauda] yonaguniensis]MDF0716099.1 GAF domain-containing sensor histidine kinase [[Muricauda] yonaguniensis]